MDKNKSIRLMAYSSIILGCFNFFLLGAYSKSEMMGNSISIFQWIVSSIFALYYIVLGIKFFIKSSNTNFNENGEFLN